MSTLIQSIEQRYGVGVYDPKKTPEVMSFPQAKPLYVGGADGDFVEEHGAWCKAKCVYGENESRIDEILAAHRKGD